MDPTRGVSADPGAPSPSATSRDRERERDRDSHRDRDRDHDRRRDRERDDRDRSHRSSRDGDRARSPRRRSRSRSPRRDSRDREDHRSSAGTSFTPSVRADHTVFVSALHPKVKERDLFEFFSQCGRVDDVRIIKDSRTKKSKGLAYVEFASTDDVHKAVALSGQLVGGYPVTIQFQSLPVSKDGQTVSEDSMRLYVGSLQYQITEADLRPFFAAFGPLDSMEIHKDPATGISKGFGFVQFRHSADAKVALSALNGVEVAGRSIKVGLATQAGSGPVHSHTLPQPHTLAPLSTIQSHPPSLYVLVTGMFDASQETEPEWYEEIADELRYEADTRHKLVDVYVDRQSSTGQVYLHYSDVESAIESFTVLNGRWFNQRQLTATFISEQQFTGRLFSAK